MEVPGRTAATRQQTEPDAAPSQRGVVPVEVEAEESVAVEVRDALDGPDQRARLIPWSDLYALQLLESEIDRGGPRKQSLISEIARSVPFH